MVLNPAEHYTEKSKTIMRYMLGQKSNNRKQGIRRIVMGWSAGTAVLGWKVNSDPSGPPWCCVAERKMGAICLCSLGILGILWGWWGRKPGPWFSGSVERETWSLLCSLVTGEGLIGLAVFSGHWCRTSSPCWVLLGFWSRKPGPCYVLWSQWNGKSEPSFCRSTIMGDLLPTQQTSFLISKQPCSLERDPFTMTWDLSTKQDRRGICLPLPSPQPPKLTFSVYAAMPGFLCWCWRSK